MPPIGVRVLANHSSRFSLCTIVTFCLSYVISRRPYTQPAFSRSHSERQRRCRRSLITGGVGDFLRRLAVQRDRDGVPTLESLLRRSTLGVGTTAVRHRKGPPS